MQRDIGNEFIVAIIAVGILAFAVAFAIILSLSGGAGQGATATPQPTALVAQVSTKTATLQADIERTSEPGEVPAATIVATLTISASSTPSVKITTTEPVQTSIPKTDVPATTTVVVKPTNTSGATIQALVASETPLLASATPIPAASATIQPTATIQVSATPISTATLWPTARNTAKPTNTPSNTPTLQQPSATATLKPSSTPLPPSATFTATTTPTIKPSATPTHTATPQPIPSATPRPTVTQTPTAQPSRTPLPTATATNIPTKTPIPPSPTSSIVMAATVVGTIAPCTIPDGWVSYTVRRGDTFLTIAQKAGTTIDILQTTNCVANINNIFVGQVLYVPGQSTATTNTSYKLDGCTDAGTQITNLTVGQLVSGIVSIEGKATVNNFAFYKLEIRPDSGKVYTLYNSYIKPVTQGVLGEVDTRIFSPGIYWLKLTVITQDNQATPYCAIPLLFAPSK